MFITKQEKDILTIKKSRNGKGFFIKKNISRNERVLKIAGKLITCDVDDEIDEETRSNTYRYNKDLYLSPKGRVGNYINHSCNPNTKVEKIGKHLFIIAIKNISKGREIFFDYSTLIASDDIWEMKCNCGSKKCRHKIKKFQSLPKVIKEKYISLKMVPNYILKY